jgi:hypothetical protein
MIPESAQSVCMHGGSNFEDHDEDGRMENGKD